MMQAIQKLPPWLGRNPGNSAIAALLAILYGPIFLHWIEGWLNKSISTEHEYFSHALIGFPYAAYLILVKQRDAWNRLENRSHPLGAVLLGLAAAFYLTGATDFVNLSLPLFLAGIFLWLKGVPGLKLEGFPLLLIFLGTPNPVPYLMTPYTLPLQKFIAAVAGFLLMQVGMEVQVNGIYLEMGGRSVEVAPYCAGLKMLFTSLYVTLILLHWSGNLSNRKRTGLLLGGAVAISVAANIIRNTLLSWFHGTGQDHNFEVLHEGWGGDLYSLLMLAAIVGLNGLMDRWEANKDGENEKVYE